MHKLNAAAVPVVIADTRAVLKMTDETLLAHAHLLASVIEGANQSNLPLAVTQPLYARLVAHGGRIVDGREELRQSITLMTAIKNVSDHREVATGCPAGAPETEPAPRFFTGAALAPERQPA